MHINEVG